MAISPGESRATIASRAVAGGPDWQIAEIVCRAGPHDRPYEEKHSRMSISAVVGGSFRYRAEHGEALLYPGALLLGNAGTCFECGHDHGTGDRCIALHIEPALFDEVSASAAGSHRFRFTAAALPAMPELIPTLVGIEALTEMARPLAAESLVIRTVERVGETLSGGKLTRTKPARGDKHRIGSVLRHIETNAGQPLDLDQLAARANMSKYHFLRTFRRVTGVTPYQFVLNLRMRRAAVRLATSPDAVAAIAYDAGFGDLSTFNNRFRAVFGAAPTKFRHAHG
ncbi:MAG: helix-turn-helix transcriptional regulator [Alphaproteobacteria bacterium]|nr:helix-turn-helix transcriptional regulator [Alphaproteobacteria bacterium]